MLDLCALSDRLDRWPFELFRSGLRGMIQLIVPIVASVVQAQWTPAPLAVKLPDSLVFATTATVTNTVLTWHPVHQRYYSARVGNATFPLHTWLATGGPSIAQTTTGIDTRGLWYNPSTGQVERNGFAAIGWATMDIDGGLNATNTFTSLFPGQLQPTTQAVGTYDPVTNTVLFYSAGVVQVRSRATGAVLSNLPLTGVPLVSIATDIMIHTGQVGYEIGLLNVAAKQVLFFSRATGTYSGMSQLPAAAVTSTSYRMGYANDRFWLFNSAAKTWNAYCLWNEGCSSSTLPVELLGQGVACYEGQVHLSWSTASEQGSSHFIIERSDDAWDWKKVGEVASAGYSQQVVEYRWMDEPPPQVSVAYYRLRQVDKDGREALFEVMPLYDCGADRVTVSVFPNPAIDELVVVVNKAPENTTAAILELRDATGRLVRRQRMGLVDRQGRTEMDLTGLGSGTYLLGVMDDAGHAIERSAVVIN
jgi:hypothetical protein